jgi:hypothetical protein
MTRTEKIREARRLRSLGWTSPAIGKQLNVSESTIRNWYLGGDCAKCGSPITRCSAKYAATICEACAHEVTAQHGSLSRYSRGCACEECRRANRESHRSLIGRPPPTHGASGYTNYGCRCQVCRDGRLVYERAKGYEHKRNHRERVKGTPPPRHGTHYAYGTFACRCDECRRAESERRQLRAAA